MGNNVDRSIQDLIIFHPENSIVLQTIKISAIRNNEELGYILLIPHSHEMYEIHTAPVSDSIKGKTNVVGIHMLKYIFTNLTKIQKLITKVPVNNRLAKLLTKRCGFKLEGCIKNSFLVDGNYIDQEIYGISKEEILCL